MWILDFYFSFLSEFDFLEVGFLKYGLIKVLVDFDIVRFSDYYNGKIYVNRDIRKELVQDSGVDFMVVFCVRFRESTFISQGLIRRQELYQSMRRRD